MGSKQRGQQHILWLQGVVKMCDEHLSDLAGFTADVDSIPLQVRPDAPHQ